MILIESLTDPVDEPLSLIVVTQSDIRRVYPRGEPARGRAGAGNRTLHTLNVRAIDFMHSNGWVPHAIRIRTCLFGYSLSSAGD